MAVFLFASVPIGMAIGLAILVGMVAMGGSGITLPPTYLPQRMFIALDSFPYVAVLFFILAGDLMQFGQMAERLLKVARAFVGHTTGGLAMISIVTCLFYGALSGSGPATAAAVGGIMIPAMVKQGYDIKFATAVNVAAGCLGVMIPPSVPMIVYGVATNTSVASLFMAGVGPGFLFAFALMLVAYVVSKRRGYVGTEKASGRERLQALWEAKYALLVPVVVLGGIYGGIVTPTEAAVIAVVYTLIIELFVHRSLNMQRLYQAFKQSALTTATIFVIVATATTLGQILTLQNVATMLAEALQSVSSNQIVALLLVNLLLLVVGCFIDAISAIVVLAPLLLPVMKIYGIDPVHFGVVMVVNLAIGFLTPPVGVNLYVGCGIAKITIEDLTKAILPFLVAVILALMVMSYLPGVSLAFPRMLGK